MTELYGDGAATPFSYLSFITNMGKALITFVHNIFWKQAEGNYQLAFQEYWRWVFSVLLLGFVLSLATVLKHPGRRQRQSVIPSRTGILVILGLLIVPHTPLFPQLLSEGPEVFDVVFLPIFLVVIVLSLLPTPGQYRPDAEERREMKKELITGKIRSLSQSEHAYPLHQRICHAILGRGLVFVLWIQWIELFGTFDYGKHLGGGFTIFWLVIWGVFIITMISLAFQSLRSPSTHRISKYRTSTVKSSSLLSSAQPPRTQPSAPGKRSSSWARKKKTTSPPR